MTSNMTRLSRRGFVRSAVALGVSGGIVGGTISPLLAADPIKPGANSPHIVNDVQN